MQTRRENAQSKGEPRKLVAQLEVAASLPAGSNERFNGYGVMGLPFRSGHVLAMRRFTASLPAIFRRDARLRGEEFGPPGSLQQQAHLGDFWIPQRGMLAIGQAYFDSFDPALHSSKTSRSAT